MTAIIQRIFSFVRCSCAALLHARAMLDSMCCIFCSFLLVFFLPNWSTNISSGESHPLWSTPGLGHWDDQDPSLGLFLLWEHCTAAVCTGLPFGRERAMPVVCLQCYNRCPHCYNMKKGEEQFYFVIVKKFTEILLGERYAEIEKKTPRFRVTYTYLQASDFWFHSKKTSWCIQSSHIWDPLVGKIPILRTVCTDQDADLQHVFPNAHILPIHILLSSTEFPVILNLNT